MDILKTLLKYILEYRHEIFSCIIFIVSLIIAIKKKKPIFNASDAAYGCLLEILPDLINKAENVEPKLSGSDKLALVVESATRLIKERFNVEIPSRTIIYWIESLLSTPQKKKGVSE